jgi:hypothetical protein
VRLPPRAEKAALVAHVAVSVGWLGAVLAFLALAIVGLTSAEPEEARAAYVAMDLAAWLVILPLALASLATGLVQSLGTPWGLFRHYWVVMKLAITVVSTAILLVHLQPIRHLADLAAEAPLLHGEHVPLRVQMIVASGLAALAILATLVLSVFKPRGLTPYGRRKQA